LSKDIEIDAAEKELLSRAIKKNISENEKLTEVRSIEAQQSCGNVYDSRTQELLYEGHILHHCNKYEKTGDPVDALTGYRLSLLTGLPCSEKVKEWMQEGLNQYALAGGNESLEDCLGLSARKSGRVPLKQRVTHLNNASIANNVERLMYYFNLDTSVAARFEALNQGRDLDGSDSIEAEYYKLRTTPSRCEKKVKAMLEGFGDDGPVVYRYELFGLFIEYRGYVGEVSTTGRKKAFQDIVEAFAQAGFTAELFEAMASEFNLCKLNNLGHEAQCL